LEEKLITTTFWIGGDSTSYNDTTNYKVPGFFLSRNYGGTDDPARRGDFYRDVSAARLIHLRRSSLQ